MNRDVKIKITKEKVSVTLDNKVTYHSTNSQEIVDALFDELSPVEIEELISVLLSATMQGILKSEQN